MYIPGIAEYLNSIEQEVMVLFDEFDKVFKSTDKMDPQAEMLTLFDGIAQGKKLFVVTCNKLDGLNDFLINRPGRFHYHFRFQYPDAAAITEYLQDALDKKYWKEINEVITFSRKVNLNYDCLRAIAFELNSGDSFAEVIKDLNIVNIERDRFTLIIQLDNGESLKIRNYALDIFSEDEMWVEFEDAERINDLAYVHFTPADNVYDYNTGRCVIKAENLKFELENYLKNAEDDTYVALYNKYKDVKPVQLIFHRQHSKDIHYLV
jgi:SpoVK/Ycf46/Vps4 family AAA+-type ATPase